MTKYTANRIGIAKTNFSGGGSWDLYDQGELVRNNKWAYLIPPGVNGGDIANGILKTVSGVNYKYHTFGSSGQLLVGTQTTVDILVVAGGGAGGFVSGGTYPSGSYGGGGGAGGVVYASSVTLPVGQYDITVGTGGNSSNLNGGDSYIYSNPLSQNILIAKGGGSGAYGLPGAGAAPGGSGGGGSPSYTTPGTGTQPTIPQYLPTVQNLGKPGAPVIPGNRSAGGGGAATSTADPLGPSRGGNGILVTPDYLDFYGDIIGIPSLNPINGYFGGGGGGTIYYTTYPYVSQEYLTGGGLGGGGLGSGWAAGSIPHPQQPYNPYSFGWNSTAGVTYTGGGGGGGMGPGTALPNAAGSAGAPGVVVLRYLA